MGITKCLQSFILFISLFSSDTRRWVPNWVSLEKKTFKKKTMGFAECKCPQARAFPK
jgi:hypothetical protein